MAKQSLQKTEHLCWHVLTLFWHFFNRLYHFFDMFWHIFDSFDIFLTDRQTDGQKDRPAYLIWHVLTLFDMFWHFFDSFWHFLTFFWPTNQPTEPSTRSSGSELKNCDANWINVKLSLDHLKVTQEFAGDNVATWL